MSAKSVASSMASSNSTRRRTRFWTRTRSCIPSPMKRSRAIESSSCPSPPTTGFRRKNAAEKYSTLPEERTSGASPLIVNRQRERKRVSCAKRPCVGVRMSPRSSETQNVEPSRIVKLTEPLSADDLILTSLLEGLDDDLVHVHVGRAGDRPQDAVGDVFRLQVVDALVDGRLAALVAGEAHVRELRVTHHARVDGRHPYAPDQLLPQHGRERADGRLGTHVHAAERVRLPPRPGAQVHDVAAAVLHVRKH